MVQAAGAGCPAAATMKSVEVQPKPASVLGLPPKAFTESPCHVSATMFNMQMHAPVLQASGNPSWLPNDLSPQCT